MGWWNKFVGGVKSIGKKVGSAVTGAAKKVGDIGSKVVNIAQKISPYVKDIPVLGKIVGGVAKAGDIVDIAKKIGQGDFRGAAEKGLMYGADMLPGRAGEIVREGKRIYEGGRGLGIF